MLTIDRVYGYNREAVLEALLATRMFRVFAPANRIDFRLDGGRIRWFNTETKNHEWCDV